jgi:hypothetical protein
MVSACQCTMCTTQVEFGCLSQNSKPPQHTLTNLCNPPILRSVQPPSLVTFSLRKHLLLLTSDYLTRLAHLTHLTRLTRVIRSAATDAVVGYVTCYWRAVTDAVVGYVTCYWRVTTARARVVTHAVTDSVILEEFKPSRPVIPKNNRSIQGRTTSATFHPQTGIQQWFSSRAPVSARYPAVSKKYAVVVKVHVVY